MKNDFGLISIILSAYNAEKTIACAIRSALEQTYPQFELLVINDGSTDGTGTIVDRAAAADSRIRRLQNAKRRGASYSRKRGLEEARGDWIAILDSDDAWAPDKLQKQIDLQKRTNADIVYTGSAFMNAAGEPIDWRLHVPPEVGYRELLKQNYISNSSAMVRKSLYAEHYVSGDHLHEDFAVWVSILRTGRKACGIDEPLLIYRVSATSKSGRKLRSARMLWRTYRFLGLKRTTAAYYMCRFAHNAIKKYRNLRRGSRPHRPAMRTRA